MKLKSKILSLLTVFLVAFTCVYYTNDAYAADETKTPHTVATTVISDTGEKLEGATVKVVAFDSEETFGTCNTDTNGYCEIKSEDLRTDTMYRIDVDKERFDHVRYVLYLDAKNDVTYEEIELPHLTTVKFKGTITDQFNYPVEDAEVIILDRFLDNQRATGKTDEDGNYSLEPDTIVEDRLYRMIAKKDGYESLEKVINNVYEGSTIFTYFKLTRKFDKLTILGDVSDTDGNPIANATVYINDANGNLVTTVQTNEKGYYECSSDLLKPNKLYKLYAEKDRFFTDKFTLVTVVPTLENLGVNAKLQVVKLNTKIYGTVNDYYDKPLEGVKVIVENSHTGEIAATTKTNKDGMYSIETDTLNEIYYNIYFEKDGYVTSPVNHLSILPELPTHHVNMNIEKIETTVYGEVIDTLGNAIGKAKVVVKDENGNVIETTITNPEGKYTITSDVFDAGKKYVLHAEKDGYHDSRDLTLSTVKDDYSYNANLQVKEYEEITVWGTVTDDKGNKVAGSTVYIEDTKHNLITKTTTDENGKYIVTSKKFDGYDGLLVHAEKTGYSFRNNYTVVDYEEYKTVYSAPFMLYKELLDINIKDSYGNALSDVEIRDGNNSSKLYAKTDASGNASFKFDDNKIHTVSFYKEGYEFIKIDVQNGKQYSVVMDKQVILQVQSREDRTLEGVKIIDTNGKVLGVTGDNGWVYIKLSDDKPHTVRLEKDGYYSQTRTIQNGKGYILLMEKAAYTIYGTVTDDKGNRLEGVNVIIEDTRNNVLSTVKTDKDGQYVITSEKFVGYDGFLVHGEKEGYTFNNSYTVITVEDHLYDYRGSFILYEEVKEVKEVNVDVTDTDGKALDQVEVKDENGKVIVTVKDGKATFVLADDKAHKLTFVKDGYKEYTAEMQNGNTYSVKLEKEKPEEKPVPPTDTDDKTEVDVPQTDDTTSTVALVAIMLLCVGGFVVLNKKKKD